MKVKFFNSKKNKKTKKNQKKQFILKNGENILTDVILYGTGWQRSLSFLNQQLLAELGFFYNSKNLSNKACLFENAEIWARLEKSRQKNACSLPTISWRSTSLPIICPKHLLPII